MLQKKALMERALGAEMGRHLGYSAGGERPKDATNQRNGKSSKTLLADDAPLNLDIPRDRDGSFAPTLISKHARRFTGFDDKIVSTCTRGMSVREIRAFLRDRSDRRPERDAPGARGHIPSHHATNVHSAPDPQ